MPINKEKYNQYLTLKADPALALMHIINRHEAEHKKEMEEYMEKCDKKMEEMMEEKMAKMEQKEPMYANFIQKIVNQAVAQVIGNAKGEKGDSIKGDDGYTPIKNKDYFDGYTPVKGKDYFDGEPGKTIVGPPGPPGKSIKGNDGKTPIRGVDYFTSIEIEELKEEIKNMINLEEILKELKELKKSIENMKKVGQLGGRTMHRGGASYTTDETLGTGDDTTVQFTLTDTPYDDTALPFLFVGGGVQFKTDDWTRNGKTITFITAPPTGAKVRAPIYRKA